MGSKSDFYIFGLILIPTNRSGLSYIWNIGPSKYKEALSWFLYNADLHREQYNNLNAHESYARYKVETICEWPDMKSGDGSCINEMKKSRAGKDLVGANLEKYFYNFWQFTTLISIRKVLILLW